jgi:hypothetical protein
VSHHAVAAKRGREVGMRRAELKRQLRAGETRVTAVLQENPDWVATMFVETLGLLTPSLWRRQYLRMATEAGVGLTATVGRLTDRQRGALAHCLDEWEAAPRQRRSGSSPRPSNQPERTMP